MEQGIRKMKNYNKPDAFRFEQAFTKGIFYIILIELVLTFICQYLFLFVGRMNIGPFYFICTAVIFYGGLIFFAFGFLETGIETDFNKAQYRKYFSRSFLRRGKWLPIDTPDYFLILKNTDLLNRWRMRTGFRRLRREYIFSHDPYFYYQLYLVTKGNNDLYIFTSEGFDLNLQTAKNLANHLHIPVYERTIKGDNLIYSPTPDQHNK